MIECIRQLIELYMYEARTNQDPLTDSQHYFVDTVPLEHFVGPHIFRGAWENNRDMLDWVTHPIFIHRSRMTIESIAFYLDDNIYIALEDPSDGYRNGLLDVVKFKEAFYYAIERIPSIPVYCAMSIDEDDHILIVTDTVNNKEILRVGTKDINDYYPMFIMEWIPENIHYNEEK